MSHYILKYSDDSVIFQNSEGQTVTQKFWPPGGGSGSGGRGPIARYLKFLAPPKEPASTSSRGKIPHTPRKYNTVWKWLPSSSTLSKYVNQYSICIRNKMHMHYVGAVYSYICWKNVLGGFSARLYWLWSLFRFYFIMCSLNQEQFWIKIQEMLYKFYITLSKELGI